MSWIVVRVRSNVNVERSIRETMDYLNLTKVNHAVIIPENDPVSYTHLTLPTILLV